MQPRRPDRRGRYLLLALLMLPFLAFGFAACGGDEEDEPPPTVTAAGPIATATAGPETTPTVRPTAMPTTGPSASASATPTAAPAVKYEGYQIIGDFTYAEAIDFPENLLMLIETGCTQCDGPTEALYRVWRNDGETHVELLVDPAISGSENAEITSFAVRPDLSEIVITVCTECGGGRPLLDSPVTVYRSLDGGITWRSIYSAAPGKPIFVQAITDEGLAFTDFDGTLFYLRGDAIEPPAGADSLLHDSNRAGELRWLANDGSTVLDNDGVPIAIVEPGSLIDAVAPESGNWTRAAVGWALNLVKGPFEGWTVTRIGPDGRLIGFRSDTYVAPVTILENGLVLGSMSIDESPFGGAIGFIETSAGKLTPIDGALVQSPFGNGEHPIGRNMPQGAVTGPFFRVTTQGTTCLPIRVSTDSQSEQLTCAANGTLVFDLHNTVTLGGQQWARVRLLDGREGYAVTSYLTIQ